MNIILWVAQVILAGVFITAGSMKAVISKKKLGTAMEWVSDYPEDRLKLIGILESLAAIAMVFPMVFSVAEILTPIAALGLAVVMVLAAIFHHNRGEKQEKITNMILLLLALFVVIGRLVGIFSGNF